MSKSQRQEWIDKLLKFHGRRPASLVSGGMESLCPVMPQNVIVRVDSNSTVIPKEIYIHQRMILKTILSGRLDTVIDGLSFPMEAGDSVLFFPFQFHSSIDAENMPKHSFIAISFTMPDNQFSPLLPLKNRVLKLPKKDLNSLNEIAEAFYSNGSLSHSKALLKLSAILVGQLEKFSSDSAEAAPQPGYYVHNAIYDFIRNNFNKKLSLKSLAAEFGCSTENIRKIFQRRYPGLTPGRLISKLQMQEAAKLLENTDSSIGAIAEKCGFADPFTFSKKFKKMIGLSPREYRLTRTANQTNT